MTEQNGNRKFCEGNLIQKLKNIHTESDMEKETLEQAIVAVKQFNALKKLISDAYKESKTLNNDIDELGCNFCTRRDKDYKCPYEHNCVQSEEEALELFFRHGLNFETKENYVL